MSIYNFFHSQMQSDGDYMGIDGLNKKGRWAVLKNLHSSVRTDLQLLQISILKETSNTSEHNMLIFRVVTGLLSILDMVSRLCDDLAPSVLTNQSDDRIYFHKYNFHESVWLRIHDLQSRLNLLRFDGKSFYQIANKLKHEIPWVGRVTTSDSCGITDIFGHGEKEISGYKPTNDDGDDDQVCFIHGFLFKVNKYTVEIIDEIKDSL